MSSYQGNPGKKVEVYTWSEGEQQFRLVRVGGKEYCSEEDNFGRWIKSRKAEAAALSELARLTCAGR